MARRTDPRPLKSRRAAFPAVSTRRSGHLAADLGSYAACHGAGHLIRIDAQLRLRVGAERIIRGQMHGHLPRQLRGQPPRLVQARELGELIFGRIGELTALLIQGSTLGITVRTDRHILPAASDEDPASSPARPAVSNAFVEFVAPATPITSPAVDTSPSLTPSTPARSTLRLPPSPSWPSAGPSPLPSPRVSLRFHHPHQPRRLALPWPRHCPRGRSRSRQWRMSSFLLAEDEPLTTRALQRRQPTRWPAGRDVRRNGA